MVPLRHPCLERSIRNEQLGQAERYLWGEGLPSEFIGCAVVSELGEKTIGPLSKKERQISNNMVMHSPQDVDVQQHIFPTKHAGLEVLLASLPIRHTETETGQSWDPHVSVALCPSSISDLGSVSLSLSRIPVFPRY